MEQVKNQSNNRSLLMRLALVKAHFIRQFTLWMRKNYNGKVFWN